MSSRKERGLPTIVTYVDCRKAYDTVWREGNFVRLFDAGVQGKMWKQIQAMSAGLRSKVRLPFGETEWIKVLRGVAQGAPESPWLYSNFINGLAEELMSLGLGVMVGDNRIPLLMYADDVVMLASTVSELRRMNEVATQYAFKYRFRYNGKKSAVMAFNADKALKRRVEEERWRLSGEKVEVKTSYKYLGVNIVTNIADWNTHVERMLTRARNKSRDLLWLCRRDIGLRPRSAATMWKALVRPMLEYAAELWAGEISKERAGKVEKIQTDFARAILGLTGVYGVPNVLVRAELGLEKLESRREKLRLGYWRRIQVASRERTFYKIAALRRRQVIMGEGEEGTRSWMWNTRSLMWKRNLGREWDEPWICRFDSKDEWKKRVYLEVEECYEDRRREEMAVMKSMGRYVRTKNWDRVSKEHATYAGEIGKLGALVCESYLDDVNEREAAKLKLLCRAGCLPVMSRIMWEVGMPADWGTCLMCESGNIESIDHLILDCNAYKRHRERLIRKINESYSVAQRGCYFEDLCYEDRLEIILGKNIGCSVMEKNIDHAFKRYLKKAWRTRRKITKILEKVIKVEDGRKSLCLALS